MGAQRLSIEAKRRENPIALVRLDDFEYREGGNVDPKIVVGQPTVSLYCLDHDSRRAIFVETPPDVDLSQAPFYYQAQYEAAILILPIIRSANRAQTVYSADVSNRLPTQTLDCR
ncbi:MAG TPA: hypothetical protein VLA19_06495 [Herpetosiphonaceae bacterium]|nr:hypothetical protein [Herpetosiphonaceae bacterium]